ncbi:MAG: hypothetical protein FJ319_05240 [SAR202 cluster bacterium]|nr:hypothetical protein [SAR202 cluster bacterium]
MHADGTLFVEIIIIMVGAFAGATIARFLRLPVIFGYLVAGVVIGPYVLKLVHDQDIVHTLAEFGVVLLMFAVGAEVSLRELRKAGKAVVLGGTAQIILTMAGFFPFALLAGWLPKEAVIMGMIVSLSSTMVVLKVLADRNELRTVHGRLMTGLHVLQDVAFIPMVALIPVLDGEAGSVVQNVGLGLLQAGAMLAVTWILGGKVIPWVLKRITLLGSRELFLLAVVAVIFGTAAVTSMTGLSAAMGAFLAGMILAESDFGHRALSEVLPLKDTFAALFFVSLGMLTDPSYILDNWMLVVWVIVLSSVLKVVFTTVFMLWFGYLPVTSILTGIGMFQVGEFSFIICGAAAALGLVDSNFVSFAVTITVLTMALTPGVMAAGDWGVARLGKRYKWLRPYKSRADDEADIDPLMHNHVVVCGLGRVGSAVAQALEQQKVPLAVIDIDPGVIDRWRARGHYGVYGVSTNENVLMAANVRFARLVIITISDPEATVRTVKKVQGIKPTVDIIAKVDWKQEADRLQKMGVRLVVLPETEASLEVLRSSLHKYNRDKNDVEHLIERLRVNLSCGADPYVREEKAPPPSRGIYNPPMRPNVSTWIAKPPSAVVPAPRATASPAKPAGSQPPLPPFVIARPVMPVRPRASAEVATSHRTARQAHRAPRAPGGAQMSFEDLQRRPEDPAQARGWVPESGETRRR